MREAAPKSEDAVLRAQNAVDRDGAPGAFARKAGKGRASGGQLAGKVPRAPSRGSETVCTCPLSWGTLAGTVLLPGEVAWSRDLEGRGGTWGREMVDKEKRAA